VQSECLDDGAPSVGLRLGREEIDQQVEVPVSGQAPEVKDGADEVVVVQLAAL
jgi:hypothetical protein